MAGQYLVPGYGIVNDPASGNQFLVPGQGITDEQVSVQSYTQNVAGGLVAGGSPVTARGVQQQVNGGVVLGGASDIIGEYASHYSQVVSGGVVLGSSSDIVGVNLQNYIQAVSGGAVFGGYGPVARGVVQQVAGGLVAGGHVTVARGAMQQVQGGLVAGGSSDVYGWSPWYVAVMPGSYRIGGVVYNLAGTITVPWLGPVVALVRFLVAPAAGSGLYRYDILGVDATGAVHVTSGTPAASPAMPAQPAGQDLLGWVLFYPGMTAISLADIGKLFVEPTPTGIAASASLSTMTWAEATSTITFTVNDQNGQPLPGTYTITTAFVRGNGSLAPSTGSIAGSSCAFTYTRGQIAGDQSPIIVFTLDGLYPLTAQVFITLLDASGNVMM